MEIPQSCSTPSNFLSPHPLLDCHEGFRQQGQGALEGDDGKLDDEVSDGYDPEEVPYLHVINLGQLEDEAAMGK